MRKLALAFLTAGFLLAGCTPLSPEQIAGLIRAACSIAVPIADISKIIDADKGATERAIVDIVCSAYKSSTTATASAAQEGERTIVVHVNGKDITIRVTPTK